MSKERDRQIDDTDKAICKAIEEQHICSYCSVALKTEAERARRVCNRCAPLLSKDRAFQSPDLDG